MSAILAGLGLEKAAFAGELAVAKRSFVPVHLGEHDVPVGRVLDLIAGTEGLLPPRTGHLGNWEDIAAGRAGAMDFNTAVCGGGHGYPLIYGFTRTESATEGGGDDVYLPGSLVDGGRRRALELFTWDGRGFARRDRERALFCPMVRTEVDGALEPLARVHLRRMRRIPGYRFATWADSLMACAPLLVDMMTVLIEAARSDPNPPRALTELVSQSVRLDGSVRRCELRPDGDGFVLDDHRFGSARELARAVLLPLRALTEPDWFFEHIASMPPVLPVISLLMTNVLFAVLGDHRPDETGVPQEGPFITHLHWGARAMAGAPPRRSGYFGRRSRVRPMRTITATLVREFERIRPVCFLLLPAPVFQLCPPSSEPADAELLARVFTAVTRAAPEAAYEVALAELAGVCGQLSPYVRDRFREGSGVPRDGEPREAAVPVEPEGFRDLTYRQACALVAAFEEIQASGGEAG